MMLRWVSTLWVLSFFAFAQGNPPVSQPGAYPAAQPSSAAPNPANQYYQTGQMPMPNPGQMPSSMMPGQPAQPAAAPAQNKGPDLTQCLDPKTFATAACSVLLSELERKCKSKGTDTAGACAQYWSAIEGTRLSECTRDAAGNPGCEMRRRYLQKECSNQLRRNSPNCLEYTRYTETSVSAPAVAVSPAATAASPSLYRVPARELPVTAEYGNAGASLTNALQDISQRLEVLEKENRALRAELRSMEDKLRMMNSRPGR